MKQEIISIENLQTAISADLSDNKQKNAAQNLLDAIHDWPSFNLQELNNFLKELHKEMGDLLTFEVIKEYRLRLTPKNDAWKMEACTSLLAIFSYDLAKTLDEIVTELNEFYFKK